MEPDEQVDAGGLNPGADEADIVGDDIPQTTAEPATAGQPGDPLEILYKNHPETILDYAEAIMPLIPLQQVPPDIGIATEDSARLRGADGEKTAVPSSGDPAHKSQPFMSVYEKTKILGFRANQLAQGARPYIVVPDFVTSTVDIARMELEQRRLPYIIKRPIPNGTFEYWRLSDLMII
jgi:DNA-directed RNA polymerase I, II, and III subunit RPABC2